MLAKSLKYFMAFLFAAALVVPAFVKEINKIITLSGETKIAGKTLKAGDYTFKVTGDKLTIEVNHKVVAEASGKWEPRDSRWTSDSLVTGTDGQVQEVRIGGEKGTFVLSGS